MNFIIDQLECVKKYTVFRLETRNGNGGKRYIKENL